MGYGIAYKAIRNYSALYKGNVSFAPSSLDYGPTSTSKYYNGIPIKDGETAIYFLNTSTGIPYCQVAKNDSEIIQLLSNLKGSTFGNLDQALTWAEGQNNIILINKTVGNQRVANLSAYFDASLRPSWSGGSTGNWQDISNNGATISSLNISGNKVLSGTAGASGLTSILDTDYHSLFFELEFTTTPSYPNGVTGGWEKIFGYNAGGSDRSPGIWRYPSQRWIHWRYDPSNSGCDFGARSGLVEFDVNKVYHVGVTKDGPNAVSYVNGLPVESSGVAFPKTAGSSALNVFEYYTGGLCNIRSLTVVNRALTPSEVYNLYMDGDIPSSGLRMSLDSSHNTSMIGTSNWTNLATVDNINYGASIPDDTYMNDAPELTVSVILEKTGTTTGYASHPVNKWNSGYNVNASFVLYHFGNYLGNNSDGLLGWYGWNTAYGWSDLTGGNYQPRMRVGDIWHVVLQWHEASGGQMWINGQKIGGRTAGGRLGNSVSPTGAVGISGPQQDGLSKVHRLDIFDRELTDSEIQAMFLGFQNRLTL